MQMQASAPDLEEVFFEALELDDPDSRASYLDRVCRDPALRRCVDRLLVIDAQSSGFLETPLSMPDEAEAPDAGPEPDGTVVSIGPYRLREAIGEGGMGVVYRAEQSDPVRREVALKVIKPGMDSRQVIARFEAERQALAIMDHPSIAKVHDAGTTGRSRPYFVMELVRGVPITEYCDRERLSVADRLGLFEAVCRAVQHAHQKGVIHRDLKPTNILVATTDGAPVPKVIDFGIAKAIGPSLTDMTLDTGLTQLVGTPLYMSPEQAEPSGLDVDTRSDVYSLGVLLYELLTGTTPIDKEALRTPITDEIRRLIREAEPPRPSTRLASIGRQINAVSECRRAEPAGLLRSIRGELDWVVMKALEKDRERRYKSPNDLADDVSRYLNDLPVAACPPSARYRFGKFARRHRALLSAGALVALVLVGWAASATVLLFENQRQARRADRNASHLAETLGSLGERLAEEFVLNGNGLTAFGAELLDDTASAIEAGVAANRGIGSVELGTTLNQLSQIRFILGDPRAALRHSEQAEAAFEADPTGPAARSGLAAAWLQSGRLLAALDRYPSAIERTERAAALLRSLVVERPDDPDPRFLLARTELNLGNLALGDRPDESVARYRAALGHVETLRRADDRPNYLEWDARTRSNLGLLMVQLGREDEAVRLQSEAVALADRLVEAGAGTVRPLDCLAACRSNLGEALAADGRLDEAEAAFEAALEPYRELDRRLPDETEGAWGVAMVQTNLAEVFTRQGRWREALEPLVQAGASYALLLERLPDNPELRANAEKQRTLLEAARGHLGSDIVGPEPGTERPSSGESRSPATEGN